jgi:hypothetical protein
MIIVLTCGFHAYPEDSAKIMNELTQIMSFEEVNSQWMDVSEM